MFKKIRVIVVILGFILLFSSLTIFYVRYSKIDTGMELVKLDNQAKIIATNMFFSQLESVGKISLTLIGLMWAFIIYKASRVEIRGFSRICLFVQSNIFLLLSFLAYFIGEDFLIGRIFYHATIDLSAPIVNFWLSMQRQFFIFGLIWSAVTILLSLSRDDKGGVVL